MNFKSLLDEMSGLGERQAALVGLMRADEARMEGAGDELRASSARRDHEVHLGRYERLMRRGDVLTGAFERVCAIMDNPQWESILRSRYLLGHGVTWTAREHGLVPRTVYKRTASAIAWVEGGRGVRRSARGDRRA